MKEEEENGDTMKEEEEKEGYWRKGPRKVR